MEQMINTYFG